MLARFKMAARPKAERLYPSLTAFEQTSTLAVSSDEEAQPMKSKKHLSNSQKKLKNNSSTKRNESFVSLNDFEDSFLSSHKDSTKTPSVSIKSSLQPYLQCLLQFVYTWKVVFLGLLMAFMVIATVDEGSGRGEG